MSGSVEIGTLAKTYAEAVWAKDPQKLAALYGKDVRVFDTWVRHPLEGRQAWRVKLDEWLMALDTEEHVKASFDELLILRGADMGCLTALVTYASLNNTGETLRSMQNRLSWIVAKSEAGWTIVHEHTSVPIGPDLSGILHP